MGIQPRTKQIHLKMMHLPPAVAISIRTNEMFNHFVDLGHPIVRQTYMWLMIMVVTHLSCFTQRVYMG